MNRTNLMYYEVVDMISLFLFAMELKQVKRYTYLFEWYSIQILTEVAVPVST